ncbi:hypothetical protein RISK_002634 [Rhodopirellula islandica]|uniref:Uncharacterized protein n=1 Tax=Rhodopirellula islandica TaxID=595434 RepID=A0A0J1BFU9_RHOIS|nr:hypothetical protein RISK_002634 [Rhodopirellula islandica]
MALGTACQCIGVDDGWVGSQVAMQFLGKPVLCIFLAIVGDVSLGRVDEIVGRNPLFESEVETRTTAGLGELPIPTDGSGFAIRLLNLVWSPRSIGCFVDPVSHIIGAPSGGVPEVQIQGAEREADRGVTVGRSNVAEDNGICATREDVLQDAIEVKRVQATTGRGCEQHVSIRTVLDRLRTECECAEVGSDDGVQKGGVPRVLVDGNDFTSIGDAVHLSGFDWIVEANPSDATRQCSPGTGGVVHCANVIRCCAVVPIFVVVCVSTIDGSGHNLSSVSIVVDCIHDRGRSWPSRSVGIGADDQSNGASCHTDVADSGLVAIVGTADADREISVYTRLIGLNPNVGPGDVVSVGEHLEIRGRIGRCWQIDVAHDAVLDVCACVGTGRSGGNRGSVPVRSGSIELRRCV